MKKLSAALSVCFAVLAFTILYINQYQDIRTTLLRVPPLNAIRHYLYLQQNDTLLESIKGTNKSLTVVTAFFTIGSFPKGTLHTVRTSNTYNVWMRTFVFMKNPVIFYTDNKTYADFFVALRKNASLLTEVVHLNRSELWAFQIIPKIKKIYSTPEYPPHYQNTFFPKYTSLTHAKQQVLDSAARKKVFDTDFYCWLDAGYFRDIVHREKTFWLEVPDDFNKSRIGVTRVFYSDLERTSARTIILGNLIWVGGGVFLGTPEVISRFHDQYKKAVMRYLNQGIMNVEHQILYAMYTKQERQKYPIDIEVQLYVPGQRQVINTNPWFYLGYVMYREGTV